MITFTLPALIDAFPLTAQLFDPTTQPMRASVVILNATGINSKLYRDFASWLAKQDIGVVTFDYRYTGLSWPPELKHLVGQEATRESHIAALRKVPKDVAITSHWAQRDAAAVVRYAADRWPAAPLTVLGHSLGGMMIPLLHQEMHLITRCLNVCGGNLHVDNYTDPLEWCHGIRSRIHAHIEKDRIFYGSRMSLGEDFSYGPGKEWLQWFMSPRCAQHTPQAEQMTRKFNKPYLYIGFEDDHIAGRRFLTQHAALFSNGDGRKASLWINPATQSPPWPTCGHVKSFVASKATKAAASPAAHPNTLLTRAETIWTLYRDYIVQGEVDRTVGTYRVWQPEDEFDPIERAEWVYSLEAGEPLRKRRLDGGGSIPGFSVISAAGVAKL
ncbi:hypothetical protein DL93DRAFT_2098175 [Clavulina sp. PMI_390]|nr:hypothetical protein DL93DRAFT_2098175 [Clavulina sp. PMI_390]